MTRLDLIFINVIHEGLVQSTYALISFKQIQNLGELGLLLGCYLFNLIFQMNVFLLQRIELCLPFGFFFTFLLLPQLFSFFELSFFDFFFLFLLFVLDKSILTFKDGNLISLTSLLPDNATHKLRVYCETMKRLFTLLQESTCPFTARILAVIHRCFNLRAGGMDSKIKLAVPNEGLKSMVDFK